MSKLKEAAEKCVSEADETAMRIVRQYATRLPGKRATDP